MYIFLLTIHVFVCFFLILVILLQAGKGGGMTETLGGNLTQSILGTRSTAFMTKLTAVCASLFLITCLSLTYLSTQKRASIFRSYKPTKATKRPQPPTVPLTAQTPIFPTTQTSATESANELPPAPATESSIEGEGEKKRVP